MKEIELSQNKDWDKRWSRLKLPLEVNKDSTSITTQEIIKIFERILPHKDGINILEIGGAPGRWLAYFKRNFNYKINAIDYSETGCNKMRENFNILKIEANIYKLDILKHDLSNIPQFDIVYSLGFIEHFNNTNHLVKKHLELLKNGGILILGVPNFSGFTKFVLKKTSPKIYETHNTDAMDIEKWKIFEENFRLEPLFKGYIGGFNLIHCKRCEKRTLINRAIRFFFKTTIAITRRIKFLRSINSKYWSPYLLGIYRKSVNFDSN